MGRRTVSECELALCSESGATTKMSPSGRSARSSTWMPRASKPSSLEIRMRRDMQRANLRRSLPEEGFSNHAQKAPGIDERIDEALLVAVNGFDRHGRDLPARPPGPDDHF